MMKKALIVLCMLVCLIGAATVCSSAATTSVKVVIPSYTCEINGKVVDYAKSKYPMISYKDITYFPMTWDYCRVMSLTSSWVEGKGLYIAYQPCSNVNIPVYDTADNSKNNIATIPTYNIYINGKLIDNTNQTYPLLNFRGVTYFPMTWQYAREEFAWNSNWANNKFSLSSGLDSGVSTSYVQTDSDGAVLYKTTTNDSGTVKWYEKYYFATGTSTGLKGYTPSTDTTGTSVEVVENEGRFVFRDQTLTEIVIPSDNSKHVLTGNLYSKNGISYYKFTLSCVDENGVSKAYKDTTYNYLDTGSKLVFLGTDVSVYNIGKAESGDFFCDVQPVTRLNKEFLSPQHILYRISATGTKKDITDSFASYNSMKLLGVMAGKAYVKCTWCKDPQVYSGQYQVSAVNDGYFTYDVSTGTLTKIANYVYTDADFMSPTGKVYGAINWNNTIRAMN